MGYERCINCMRKIRSGTTVCPLCGVSQHPDENYPYALRPNTILHGRYLLGNVLGQGGFGITYVGFDLELEIKVAVKEYFPRVAAGRSTSDSARVVWDRTQLGAREADQAVRSFLKEARSLAKMDEMPGIVRVRETFAENQTAYLVMDFVEGETLKKQIQENGPMQPEACIRFLEPLFESLEAMHRRGLIHRDISPDNIMVRPDGTPCLLDLGSARDLMSATCTTHMVTKQSFSPPEQCISGGKIREWTDVYAMTATIYHMLTGKLLPNATDRLYLEKYERAGKVYGGIELDFTPLTGEELPPALIAVLRDGLALRPEDRIPTIAGLKKRLLKALEPEQSGAPVLPSRHRNRILALVCAAAAVLVCAVLFSSENLTGTQEETAVSVAASLTAEAAQENLLAGESGNSGHVLGSDYARTEIITVTFVDYIQENDTSWDVSEAGDGSVLAWVEPNGEGYDLYIGGDGGVSLSSGSQLFRGYTNMEEIHFNSCLDTGSVSDMSYMFYECQNLTVLDTSGFDTANVTDMSYMFYDCSSLTSLDMSSFDTSNVTDLRYMLKGCSSLETVQLGGLDTGKVTSMSSMFEGCSALSSLDVSGFDTGNVLHMSSMFEGCSSLMSLDVSGFDTSNVTSMSSMFEECSSLTSLDVSGFDTSNVTVMSSMFYGCSSLTSLDVSGFDTSNVTNMSFMFYGCSSLENIDVSGFVIGEDTDTLYIFKRAGVTAEEAGLPN